MGLKEFIPHFVQGSLFLILFAVGLKARWKDLTSIFRQPGLLIRGLIAVNFVVPLVAVVVLSLLPVEPAIKVGLVIMAVSPLAPFLPGKMLKTGADSSHAVGLYAALVLASVVVVPATAALLSAIFTTDITIPVSAIAGNVLTSILAPLVAGVMAGTLWPKLSKRAAPILTRIAYVFLLPVVALILFTAGRHIPSLIGNGAVAAIFVTVAAGLAAGHWLGGPVPSNRRALAEAAAARHPGIAGMIAHRHFDDQRVTLAVLLFLLTSIIISSMYQAWAGKRYSM